MNEAIDLRYLVQAPCKGFKAFAMSAYGVSGMSALVIPFGVSQLLLLVLRYEHTNYLCPYVGQL